MDQLTPVGNISLIIILVCLMIFAAIGFIAYLARQVVAAFVINFLITAKLIFDGIPEGYATAYESGPKGQGKFIGLACSYGEFGAVKASGDLDWAIRRIGESDVWETPEKRDADNNVIEPAKKVTHQYLTKDDFHWDRRPEWLKKLFPEGTGVVYMGLPGVVHPKEYNLRMSNFRTVKPGEDEINKRKLEVRPYTLGGENVTGTAGFLVSWNERTTRVGLFDDTYPIPIDGVRIGVFKDDKTQQGIEANILVVIRARISRPRLFLYRVEDALEMVENSIIEHVRQMVAGMTIEEVYALRMGLGTEEEKNNSLKSPKEGSKAPGKESKTLGDNPILDQGFADYIETRYGFKVKAAGFGFIEIIGTAAAAISRPYEATKDKEAMIIRGEGEGEAEKRRLTKVNEAFKGLDSEERENLAAMRTADVATAFANSKDKGVNTLVFGFNPDNFLGGNLFKRPGETAPSPTTPKPSASPKDAVEETEAKK